MLKTVMTRSALIAFACAISLSAHAMADAAKRAINIPSGDLATALELLAKQAGADIVYRPEQVQGLKTRGAKGDLSPGEAAAKLLEGTSLSVSTDSTGAMLIAAPLPSGKQAAVSSQSSAERQANGEDSSKSADGKAGRSFWDRFRVAQVDQGAPASSATVGKKSDQTPDNKPVQLEEVLVTAQKRTERLQDVPVPVTAISAAMLVNQNLVRLQDYYNSVPGLSVATGDFRGDPILTIRGITTGGGGLVSPTVGVVIDDVPYGSSTGKGGGGPAIDIDPSDLSRVEVLRGPQGTLYGVSSIGGLLKYVTVDPTTDGFSGRVQVGISGVRNGADAGYNARAAANFPFSETLAIRASGFFRQDPGYVDDVLTGQNDVNKANVYGVHLSALWRPTEAVSLKLSAMFQDIKTDGSPNINPQLGDLNQNAVRGTGWYDKNTQAYSAIVKAKLGAVDLTSLSGYSVNHVRDAVDYSYILGIYSQQIFGWPPTFVFTDNIRTSKFTQEVRLSTPIGNRLEWLLGGFYTHERTPYVETDYASDPVTGQLAGYWLTTDSYPTTYEEYAAFTDLTVHVTDRFDIQIGGRESNNRQSYTETFIGVAAPIFFGHPSPLIQPLVHTEDNSFTYLVTPQFKVSRELMVYARLASGYRAGGPNANAALYNLPLSFAPDTTHNYEIGIKGDALGHVLSFDASLYYINWKDIQLQLTAPVTGANYYANGSRAKSQGVELSLESRPLEGLKVAGWVAFNDAALTEPFPPGGPGSPTAGSGDRLPGSSRFSGNLSIDEEFRLTGRMRGFVGGALSYVGDRKGIFLASPERQELPSYTSTDVRAGVKQDSWTINLFVTNAFDRRGLLGGGLGTINPAHFNYIQPRTYGMSVIKAF